METTVQQTLPLARGVVGSVGADGRQMSEGKRMEVCTCMMLYSYPRSFEAQINEAQVNVATTGASSAHTLLRVYVLCRRLLLCVRLFRCGWGDCFKQPCIMPCYENFPAFTTVPRGALLLIVA